MVLRGESVANQVDKLTRQVALTALSTVITETPVDTGRARSNWQVALGVPPGASIETYGEGAAGAAVSAGSSVIAGYRAGQAIYISNNLPYIGRLNEGWSAQAPANFVESAVAQAVRVVTKGQLVVSIVGG